MKEFESTKRSATEEEVRVPFSIGQEHLLKKDRFVYEIIASDPPAGIFFDIAALVEGTPIERLAGVARILDCTLSPESAAHFADRIRSRDPEERIDLDQAIGIVQWVLEQITSRPTSPSRGSSGGALTTGASSTASSRRKVSTP